MWSMIVAVGIAAAWFEYSYRRQRRSKKDTGGPNGDAKKTPASAAPTEVEAGETAKPLHATSSND